MRMKKVLFSLAVFLALAATVPAQSADLPLTGVVLFTNGVGYFVREGRVTGSGSVELRFNVKDINDLLKSMVLRDFDGGKITGVNYASREPLAKTLKTFSLDLSANPDLAGLLNQARGEKIEAWAGKRYEGTVLGVEARTAESGERKVFLNLLTGDGLQTVLFEAVTSFKFAKDKLNEELRAALTLIAESRNADKKGVVINYAGTGTRRIQAGYLLETPVWKTSYRLVVGEKAPHLLQGWAIVENVTDEDWKNVKLDLVSGMPVSFSMDLYQPLFNRRPEVAYSVQQNLASQTYAGGVAPSPAPKPAYAPMAAPSAAKLAERAYDKRSKEEYAPEEAKEDRLDLTQGIQATASAESVGEFFRYAIQDPVSLPRQQSAMIPILNQQVEGDRVSIYNERVHKKYPMNGLKLKNTSALSLMGGPLTVFEGGAYAGDARIETLPPGGTRLLSYSLDLDTEVLNLDASMPEQITRIKLLRGTLYVSKIVKKVRTYTLVNRGDRSRTILVEHPASYDWKLTEPATYEEKIEGAYRFAVKTAPARDAKTELRVVEERQVEQSAALSNMGQDYLLFYINQKTISDKAREALKTLAGMKNELADITRQRQGVEEQIQRIYREQERIRNNMSNLDRASALYQRYMTALNDQENTINGLKEKLDDLQVKEAAKKKATEDFIAGLDV